ncbi:unnamed protein product [Prorocentrum cordatum]|uniref:Uncharacterized protein n=1 Tax=Prorocentrum cordatum TaxID=2364126 RepID=A0ABN9PHS2_9DINO|nr:unnamed protein product [Polarella glacialis]
MPVLKLAERVAGLKLNLPKCVVVVTHELNRIEFDRLMLDHDIELPGVVLGTAGKYLGIWGRASEGVLRHALTGGAQRTWHRSDGGGACGDDLEKYRSEGRQPCTGAVPGQAPPGFRRSVSDVGGDGSLHRAALEVARGALLAAHSATGLTTGRPELRESLRIFRAAEGMLRAAVDMLTSPLLLLGGGGGPVAAAARRARQRMTNMDDALADELRLVRRDGGPPSSAASGTDKDKGTGKALGRQLSVRMRFAIEGVCADPGPGMGAGPGPARACAAGAPCRQEGGPGRRSSERLAAQAGPRLGGGPPAAPMWRLLESWCYCCRCHWGFVVRTSERTLDDYLKLFRRTMAADLVLALLYAVHVSDWVTRRRGAAEGAAGTAMTVLGVWTVGCFCFDAVLVWLLARCVRGAADGPSVRSEELDSVATWQLACVGHSCAGLALFGARYLLEMSQIGFATRWAACTLALIFLAKAAGVVALGSFGRWLWLQSDEAKTLTLTRSASHSTLYSDSDADLEEEDWAG